MIRRIIDYCQTNGWYNFWIIIDSQFGLGRLEYILISNWFNPFATLWTNLRSFPLPQALHFPIAVYGTPRLICLSGKMQIIGKIHLGMIEFNKVRHGAPNNMSCKSEIYDKGKIIFFGSCKIGTGNKIMVAQHAVLQIGKNSKITDMCNIGCFSKIIIGEQSRITHRCQVLDSNYHYVADFSRGVVPRYTYPIVIGKGCWICNTTTIAGGTFLPDFTIIASNSLVNKDFSDLPSGSMIGGVPAKLLAKGFRKVENVNIERRIADFFKANPQENIYPIPEEDNMDDYSLIIE